MNNVELRAKIIAFLDDALRMAEELDDGAMAYLVDRALDEARSKQFSSVAEAPLH